MRLKIMLLKIFLRILGALMAEKFRYSQEYEDNFKYMDLQEKLWWGYKALIRQIEDAEKGKQIEEYFADQDLEFKPDNGFRVENILTVTAGGDLSTSEVVFPESVSHLWDDVASFYFSGEIVCANLETPLDTSKPVGMVPRVCLTAPNLNTSPAMFEKFTLGGKGINFFATANNHSLDQGEPGLVATLDFLDANGYPHVGTSRTLAEQRDIPIIERNGIRMAFLSYTYCLNAYDPIPGKEYMTNVIRLNKPDTDIGLIKEHVNVARDKKADVIVAMLHWSVEFETYPIQNVITMGHRILESGVDIILGGHPHVAQPMERYSFEDPLTRRKKTGFIIYSLGELVSYNAFSKNSRLALLIKLTISKGTKNGTPATLLTDLKVFPIYTWIRKLPDGGWDYRLLDFLKTVACLRAGENPYGFNKKQRNELYRLDALLKNKLLPKNFI